MPLPIDGPTVGRVLLRESAYERLESAIVEGRLAPGERLRDEDLSRQLGVSRTPIREALARLADAGLVETAVNRYTRVAPIAFSEARTGFAIAAALHGIAAQLAVARLEAEQVDELRAESERFTWAIWRREIEPAVAADSRFHAVLADAAGSAQLRGHLQLVMPSLRRLERVVWPQMGERPGAEHHAALLVATEAGDAIAARNSGGAEWNALGDAVTAALPG